MQKPHVLPPWDPRQWNEKGTEKHDICLAMILSSNIHRIIIVLNLFLLLALSSVIIVFATGIETHKHTNTHTHTHTHTHRQTHPHVLYSTTSALDGSQHICGVLRTRTLIKGHGRSNSWGLCNHAGAPALALGDAYRSHIHHPRK